MRRYAPLAPSAGTVIPSDVRAIVKARDRYCVCDRAGFPEAVQARCGGELGEDHVRASHGIGLKSRSTPDNLVVLSAWCHRWKTENGRTARPLLLAYLSSSEHPHVEPVPGCATCYEVFG